MTNNKDNGGMLRTLPEECYYFKEDILSEVLVLPYGKPDMGKVVDLMIYPRVEDIYIVDKVNYTSSNGKRVSGLKLVAEISVTEKVTYAERGSCNYKIATNFNLFKSISIVIPESVNGESTKQLIKLGKVNVVPYIETVYKRQLNERSLYSSVLLLLEVNIFNKGAVSSDSKYYYR